ncbi:MAG TPA: Rdx family protein [Bacillota bacterium]|nr:Rdx family protein [Bacillota bacterium]HNT02795.1 Rdx family protein [Bacillota bacterium]HPA55227.1 Rdx family protein [Bacillota bacterium]HPX67986.1 Rdx family protein [Bacillota bacterium]HQA64365.1 Rdx family protein [Bacillota bacterium]
MLLFYLNTYNKNSISSLTLIPSSGGVLKVKLNNELIFSKKSAGRFPKEDEVEKLPIARLQ